MKYLTYMVLLSIRDPCIQKTRLHVNRTENMNMEINVATLAF